MIYQFLKIKKGMMNVAIQDSGERREFESGAVRDIQEGKGRCDLLPLEIVGNILNIGELHHINRFIRTLDKEDLILALSTFANNGKMDSTELIFEVSKQFEEGATKYGERNWEKGIPVHCYINSAVRHLLKYYRGDNDERHDRAFAWNILCCLWTIENKPELQDIIAN